MKVNVRKFQVGGQMDPAMMEDPNAQMPAEGAAEAPQGQDQAMAQLQELAANIIQQLGPDAAAALAQMIMEMLQSGEGAPEEMAPTFQRNGGRITRIR